MAYEGKLASFFRDTVRISRILDGFHDIRKHPRIRLRDILLSVFFMPVVGVTALLRLNSQLRTPAMLRLFRCAKDKKVVVSDTTIPRVLHWLKPQQSRHALLAPCAKLEEKNLLTRQLTPTSAPRRLGVFDGSQMGGHYLVAALLCGTVNCPVLAEPCKGRGHESKTTQHWLPILQQQLGPCAPELWLLDSHYFNQSSFQTVRDLEAHLLIMYNPHDEQEPDDKLFRDVLEDAKRLFAAKSPALEPVEQSHGFDSRRWCSWSMK